MAFSGSPKGAYHHGDLRNALIAVATRLPHDGGPGAVTIRAAAREVGVTPTAAYRHFAGREELLAATKECAMQELTVAMEEELAGRAPAADPVLDALGELGALGRAYIAFARANPGLYQTMFSPDGPPFEALFADGPMHGPFGMLVRTLDRLVETGFVPPDRRPQADIAAWSMVHGLATLLDGPLRIMPDQARDEAITRTMQLFGNGLGGTGLSAVQQAALAEELRGALAARSGSADTAQPG